VRERLPLLAQERWYGHAKRGYARGWEPVQFVDRIQRFLTLLEWQPAEPATQQAEVQATPAAAPGTSAAVAAGAPAAAAAVAGASARAGSARAQ
jgi:membrane-bound lytic murein transglycosylase F